MRLKNEANTPQQYWYVHTPKNLDYMRGKAVVLVVNSEHGDLLCGDSTAAKDRIVQLDAQTKSIKVKKDILHHQGSKLTICQ